MDQGSADQIAWVEIAQAIRGQLLGMAELMPAMKPDEVKTFVETAQAAQYLDRNAMTFDRDV